MVAYGRDTDEPATPCPAELARGGARVSGLAVALP